jgi:uncharacterized repeat protein (TIGR02543 family)
LSPGCDSGADLGYELDMAENPAAGGTATDLTGGGRYLEGDEATIQAVAASCYQFTGWTSSDGGTFDDDTAATTNFTMPAQDVTVTANFELKPVDHYRVYDVDYETAPYIGEEVQLEDQFGAFNKTVGKAYWFGNPVDKTYKDELTPMSDENNHLAFYILEPEEGYIFQSVEVTNQFGTYNLSLAGPFALAVPTQKLVPGDHDKWDCVDHFTVYEVTDYKEIEGLYVDLDDQFSFEQEVQVYAPVLFAVPVQKTCGSETTDIENPNLENHLVIYHTSLKVWDETVVVSNQFLDGEDQTLNLEDAELLAVPSQKIAPPVPPLDHFKCYPAGGPPLELMYVYLEDQFGYYWDVQVLSPMFFCNPVQKNLEPRVNDDGHLTVYSILGATPKMWDVVVNNQFGDGQTLTVQGPVALATPTQKHVPGDHGMPMYVDHYSLYTVLAGSSVAATVDLDDQFGIDSDVSVTTPLYFACPCLKGHVDDWAPWHPYGHLLFYAIDSTNYFSDPILVSNQFLQQFYLSLDDVGQLLAVPSEKVSYKLFEE